MIALRGSIPACAGKPCVASGRGSLGRVHPRVRGEAADIDYTTLRNWGPSPRARGSHGQGSREDRRHGSIPACAGKPCTRSRGCAWRWVHPRVRGEASNNPTNGQFLSGPSPRARGSRHGVLAMPVLHGSIPACAGKPRPGTAFCRERRVHPRVRGEASAKAAAYPATRGPSPRARGSRLLITKSRTTMGSIPACAGKPPHFSASRASRRVHPRVRGEARSGAIVTGSMRGPSPRARGSLHYPIDGNPNTGSIPACAGKPPQRRWSRSRNRVHPRVRGEAS